MLVTESDKIREDIRKLTETYGRDRSALMPILQEVQKKYCRISDIAMQEIADLLSIHPVEVYGVVSFYSFLDDKPKGRFIIRLCRTISCTMQGKARVAKQLENDLGVLFGQTTADGLFTLEWANCLGMCDQGPALLVNDQVFTQVTPDKVHDIIEGCRRSFAQHVSQKREEH
ncbi:MAG TPA: NADH-quinone oxidoreductase subunit NuoE [Phycisphaerales bacterium]|nr:NADH-quinone oxidoreductase subunit NuoE [Phycisphaerales bacterium]